MNIDFNNNLVLIWLTNEDQTSPSSLQIVDLIKDHFSDSKTKVVVYNSGKENLIQCTKNLLSQNRHLV